MADQRDTTNVKSTTPGSNKAKLRRFALLYEEVSGKKKAAPKSGFLLNPVRCRD
jgi:hypothetical protein